MFVAVGLSAQSATAISASEVSTGTLIAAETQPGVQLVQATFSASLSVPVPTMDQAAVANLKAQLIQEVASGQIGSDNTSILNAFADAVDASPLTYLVPSGQVETQQSSIVSIGTGWVVTPDGYMVTADHVVDPAQADIKNAFAKHALSVLDQKAAAGISQGLASSGLTPTSSQIAKLTDAVSVFFADNLSVTNLTSSVTAQLGTAVTGIGKGTHPISVSVIAKGSPYPGQDVAILKAEGQSNMPTIPLGHDSSVNEGDNLYLVGYPAASTFDSLESPSSQVIPTMTEGPLTAKKNAANTDMPIFQVQTPASPGSSGSPILDSNGHAVAVLVTGAIDQNGSQIPGQNFAIPVSIVREFLDRSNIHPSASITTSTYDTALVDYYRHYYKRAVPLFQEVKNLYPNQPYVGDLISNSQTAIAQGKDQTPSFPWLLLIVVIAVVVLGGATLGGLLVLRGRRKPAAAAGTMLAGTQPGFPVAPVPGAAPSVQAGTPPGQWAQPTAPSYAPQAAPTQQAPPQPVVPQAAPTQQAPPQPVVPQAAPTQQAPPQPVVPQAAPTQQAPQQPVARYCSSCGAELPPVGGFCPTCGGVRS
ncbi:MAG: trypsin-like peptidase domain-containing protein [Acidimicrobiales bacterium]